MLHAFQSQPDRPYVEEFRVLVEKVAAYFNDAGVAVKPYHDPALPHFSRLPVEARAQAVGEAHLYWSIVEDHRAERIDPRNSARALWSVLKVSGLTPPADLFARIQNDDCLELYNTKSIQIWRNLRMMELCSYTLEEMHCFTWAQRYERLPADHEAMARAATAVLSGQLTYVRLPVATHPIQERFSERRLRLEAQHDEMFALHDRAGNLGAILVRSKGAVRNEWSPSLLRPTPFSVCPEITD